MNLIAIVGTAVCWLVMVIFVPGMFWVCVLLTAYIVIYAIGVIGKLIIDRCTRSRSAAARNFFMEE